MNAENEERKQEETAVEPEDTPSRQAAAERGNASRSEGRMRNMFSRHPIICGIITGFLVAALLGGMFAVGYVVGKPDDKRSETWFSPRFRPLEERGLAPRERLRELREEFRGEIQRWGDILAECREELGEFVASQLGISVEELKNELREGKTVADLAEEKGRSSEELVESLSAKIEEMADRLAAEDKIPPYMAEAVKDHSETLASLLVHGGLRLLGFPARK